MGSPDADVEETPGHAESEPALKVKDVTPNTSVRLIHPWETPYARATSCWERPSTRSFALGRGPLPDDGGMREVDAEESVAGCE